MIQYKQIAKYPPAGGAVRKFDTGKLNNCNKMHNFLIFLESNKTNWYRAISFNIVLYIGFGLKFLTSLHLAVHTEEH